MSRDAGEFQNLQPASAEEESSPSRDRPAVRLESGAPGLRPRGLGELLDLAFEVLRARFGTYVGVAALIYLPLRAAQPFIGMHQWDTPSAGMFLGFVFNTGAALVLAFLEASVLAVLVAGHLEGRHVTAGAAFRRALSRLFSVGVIAILGGMLSAVGYFCLCLPGLVLTWLLYLAPAVCVIENVGIAESISRSFELAGRRFLPWIPLALATFLLGLPFTGFVAAVDDPTARAWMLESLSVPALAFDWTMVVVTSLFYGVAAAVRGVVVTVWYFDCRARRDGADLAARIERAGGSWRTEPAS